MKKSDVLEQLAVLLDGSIKPLKEMFAESDFVEYDGNAFVKLVALLRVAKTTYGVRGYACNVCQSPRQDNGWCATVVARYELGGAKGFEQSNFIFDGAADCREGTTGDGFDKYMTAMAEARAKARALRDALGVEVCSSEEIVRSSNKERIFVNSNGKEPIESTQAMVIRNKFINGLGKTLEDISTIIDRPIKTLEELTKEEAGQVLESFNKSHKK